MSKCLRCSSLVAVLALVVAMTPAAAAPQVASDDHQPIAQRLLTLHGGLVVRGTTRADDGRWSWKRDGSWVDLPLGAVVSVRDEDDARVELSQRRSKLRKAAPAQRVPLVEWMLKTGFYTEGMAELDRMLAEDPDDPATLGLLDRDNLPVRVPSLGGDASGTGGGEVADLLDYAARSPASLQELVVRELSHLSLSERRSLQPRLAAGLVSPESLRRRFSALALRRLFPGFSVDELTRRAVLDPAEEVRIQAALALRDTGEESVVDPLARALASASSTVRTHAAQSLGLSGFAAAVEPLALRLSSLKPGGAGGQVAPRGTIFVGRQIAYVQGFSAEIATNSAIGDPLIGTLQEGVTLDAKVFGASGGGGYTYSHETKQLRHSLAKLTGVNVRDTNSAWKQWWKTSGEGWVREHMVTIADGCRREPAQ